MSFLTHLVLPNFCTNNIIKALALKCRYLHYEKRGTLPGAPLLFFAFSSPYTQLISLMVAEEKAIS